MLIMKDSPFPIIKIFLKLLLLTFLWSCQSTSTGIGVKTSKIQTNLNQKSLVNNKKETIDVLNIDYNEAIQLAFEAGKNAYKIVAISDDNSSVMIENKVFGLVMQEHI